MPWHGANLHEASRHLASLIPWRAQAVHWLGRRSLDCAAVPSAIAVGPSPPSDPTVAQSQKKDNDGAPAGCRVNTLDEFLCHHGCRISTGAVHAARHRRDLRLAQTLLCPAGGMAALKTVLHPNLAVSTMDKWCGRRGSRHLPRPANCPCVAGRRPTHASREHGDS
jgi:hypothetical protein